MNNCSGCRVSCFIAPYIYEIGFTCPCSTCILKVMCSEQCLERKDTYIHVNELLRDRKKKERDMREYQRAINKLRIT
jgi:hypothetical protein